MDWIELYCVSGGCMACWLVKMLWIC